MRAAQKVLLTATVAVVEAVGRGICLARNGSSTGAQAQPPVQKKQVRGQVADEAGQPVAGAAWKISGTEVLQGGSLPPGVFNGYHETSVAL
jgi:hypothetical protein